MNTDAAREAKRKYKKEKVSRLTLEFSPKDQDLLNHINSQAKKQTYIKSLIRADLDKCAKTNAD